MKTITLLNVPNHGFTVVEDNDFYEITIKTIGEECYVNILRNNENIVPYIKAIPNQLIIPYSYKDREHGNFKFISAGNDYPSYKEFNYTTIFKYLNKQEVLDDRSS